MTLVGEFSAMEIMYNIKQGHTKLCVTKIDISVIYDDYVHSSVLNYFQIKYLIEYDKVMKYYELVCTTTQVLCTCTRLYDP